VGTCPMPTVPDICGGSSSWSTWLTQRMGKVTLKLEEGSETTSLPMVPYTAPTPY